MIPFLTSGRVSAVATVVLACAGITIPAILDSQQQETSAKRWTIEYYRSVFDSPQGRLIEEITSKAEFFIWEEFKIQRERNDKLPDNQKESYDQLARKIDKALIDHLRVRYGESKFRTLVIFLLKTSDTVYECAGFHELFEDTGSLKLDDSGRLALAGTSRGYFEIFRNSFEGFLGTRMTGPECHQESMIKLFGRRFSEPFWYLRYYLYCDDFIGENYFRDKHSSTPLYRLESIAMASEKADLDFRYPDKSSVVVRTKKQSDAYKADSDIMTANFRLEECL